MIYRVVKLAFNPLVYENVCIIIRSPAMRISAISQRKTFNRVLPTQWRRKAAGIEITSLSPYVQLTVQARDLECSSSNMSQSFAVFGSKLKAEIFNRAYSRQHPRDRLH